MSWVPSGGDDRERMCGVLGIGGVEELFGVVPASLRFPELALPEALSEAEVLEELGRLAGRNLDAATVDWFLGAGVYRHFVPAVVDSLASRGEFLTAYTPYQPEVSQGTLQVMFEYQSMAARLFGMDFANASHYDGATALAEAVLMCAAAGGPGRKEVVLPRMLHPEYRDVLDAWLGARGLQARTYDDDPAQAGAEAGTACVVAAWPDFRGEVHDLRTAAEAAHKAGARLVVLADPLLCAMVRNPGESGADVVVAEGQCLGNHMNLGGPGIGMMAARNDLLRRMPGRVAGEAYDREGRRGFVLTLSAREQHIRRERAVSNICSNQGLIMVRAAIYLALMGKHGLAEQARLCWDKAHFAAGLLGAIPGCTVTNRTHFKEFVLQLPMPASRLVERLAGQGVVPGFDMGRYWKERDRELLVCVTELNSRESVERLAAAIEREVVS